MKMCSRARYAPSRTRPASASISRAGSPAKIELPRRSAATSLADIGGRIARAAALPARCSDPGPDTCGRCWSLDTANPVVVELDRLCATALRVQVQQAQGRGRRGGTHRRDFADEVVVIDETHDGRAP